MSTPEQYFTFDSSTGTITGYNVAGGLDVVIPPTIGGVDVINVGGFASKNITSVIIPYGVVNINQAAFFTNLNLTMVVIPNSVVSIGDNAFMHCDLQQLELSINLETIGIASFLNNLALTKLDIPHSVTSIGNTAFQGIAVTEVKIGSNVTLGNHTSIGGMLFDIDTVATFYNDNGKEAGIYTYTGEVWEYSPIPYTLKISTPSGIVSMATLDETGNVPANQLNNVEAMEQHGNEWHSEAFITEVDFNTHKELEMPHKYIDEKGNIYAWGFGVKDGHWGLITEQLPQAGDYMAGYYGKETGLITGEDLCIEVGLTAGTLVHSGDITWLKFAHNHKTLFVADRAIRRDISWSNIQAQDLVKGKVIEIQDRLYLCRLITGGNSNPANNHGGEWDDLIVQFTSSDEDSNWIDTYTWCQEISSEDILKRIIRGATSVDGFFTWRMDEHAIITGDASEYRPFHYRPILELL